MEHQIKNLVVYALMHNYEEKPFKELLKDFLWNLKFEQEKLETQQNNVQSL